MSVKLKSVLAFSPHSQKTLAPVWRHHNNARISFHFFYKSTLFVKPAYITIAVTNSNISIVHNLKCSWLELKLKFIQVASKAQLILKYEIVFANRKKSIANRMKLTASDCSVTM